MTNQYYTSFHTILHFTLFLRPLHWLLSPVWLVSSIWCWRAGHPWCRAWKGKSDDSDNWDLALLGQTFPRINFDTRHVMSWCKTFQGPAHTILYHQTFQLTHHSLGESVSTAKLNVLQSECRANSIDEDWRQRWWCLLYTSCWSWSWVGWLFSFSLDHCESALFRK